MPKVTVQAAFKSPVYRVWQVVTDLTDWEWREDLSEIESSPDGKSFIEYTTKGYPTLFRITAFAPGRWYAFDLENEHLTGRWEGFFQAVPGGGTVVEFTEEVEARGKMPNFLLEMYLRRQQRRYIEMLRRGLGEED